MLKFPAINRKLFKKNFKYKTDFDSKTNLLSTLHNIALERKSDFQKIEYDDNLYLTAIEEKRISDRRSYIFRFASMLALTCIMIFFHLAF